MRGILRITLGLLGLFTATFLVASATGWISEARVHAALLAHGGASLAALAVVGMLVADLALPIPSSVVMTAAGYLFGMPGAALSALGLVAGAQLGFELGRAGRRLRPLRLDDGSAARLAELFARHGTWVLLSCRAVPMVAETASCLAGIAGVPRLRFVALTAISAAPPSLLYAWAGAGAHGEVGTLAWSVALGGPALAFAAFGAAARVKSAARAS